MSRSKALSAVRSVAGKLPSITKSSGKLIAAAAYYQKFMEAIGIPDDENSKDTAYRVAKMFVDELCGGLAQQPPELRVFSANNYGQYIVVRDIPYYSLCAHHHITFFGTADICYFPDKHVLGLSKFARVVQHFAARPQIQELLTEEVADYLHAKLKPKGIVVRMTGEHLCMEARGAKAVGSSTITQALRGDSIDKNEVMHLLGRR